MDERLLVTTMADRIEQGPVDPRALVILWAMVNGPPPLDGVDEPRTREEVRSRLRTAWALIKDDTFEVAAAAADRSSETPSRQAGTTPPSKFSARYRR
jgi:hypothetical protein